MAVTDQPRWTLTLYVSGASMHSTEAIENVRRICDEELAGQVDLSVVDVTDKPALAISDQILAVPTLVKRLPEPFRQLVGDLADPQRVRAGLDLGQVTITQPEPEPEPTTPRRAPTAGD